MKKKYQKISGNLSEIQFIRNHKMISIILAYFIVGIIYDITGYLYNIIIGREVVFSPLLTIPLGALFWPVMIYADLKHIGVMPQDVLALISLIVSVTILLKNWK